MAEKHEIMALEPVKKTKRERLMWRVVEIIPESGTYSSEDKLRVLMEYALNGSIKKTAEVTLVPRGTIRDWQKTDWWPQAYELVCEIQQRKMSARLAGLQARAMDNLEKALDTGEEVIVKGREGFEKTHKQVSARDLMYIMATAADKQHRIRQSEKEDETDGKSPTDKFSNRLLSLAEQLAAVAKNAQGAQARTIESEADRVDEEVIEDESAN